MSLSTYITLDSSNAVLGDYRLISKLYDSDYAYMVVVRKFRFEINLAWFIVSTTVTFKKKE